MKIRAFTLIELLIVVAIIAILAAIAVPNFLEAQVRAKVSRIKTDMRTVNTALEAYRVDNNKYPPWADWRAAERGGDQSKSTNKFDYYNDGALFHAKIPNYLTTPIAYNTTIPEDVFIKASTFSNARYPVASRVGFRFQYFPYQGLYENTPEGNTKNTYGYRSEHTGGWMFYSFGPDNNSNALTPAATAGVVGVYTRYDPTNGTVSRGNILRTAASPEGSIARHPLITSTQNGQN